MKRTFTLIALLFTIICKAQPVFQSVNWPSATAGLTATVLIAPKPTSPGPSGAGVTWNFSSLTFTAAGSASVVLPSSTPYASSFSGATHAAIVALPTGTVYNYDNVQTTYKDQIGEGIQAASGSTYTPDPKRHLVFPFNYTNSYSDSYQCVSCAPGNFTVTYDAWGTLIVNGKTYNNVARVVNMFGSPYYNYYSTNPIISILAYDSSPTGSPYATLIESNALLSGMSESYVVKHMNVFPNPSNDNITLQNNNFVKVEFAICDLFGKEVRTAEKLTQGETSQIDISSYAPGVYFIKYHDEFGNNSYTKLIVE